MNNHEKFQTRTVILLDAARKELAVNMIKNAPIGIEIVAREVVKTRKLDQNALYWAGPLSDIANQAWFAGRKYCPEIWHENFKRDLLPEEDNPNLHDLVKNPFKYRKWDYLPGSDERICVGSTTDLTINGFSEYLEQVYAFGAQLGVMFSVSPR